MSVRSLSLQPESNGNIFAAACYRAVRMFDVRNNAFSIYRLKIPTNSKTINIIFKKI